MTKPTLAITLGDVAGIGPEITAKTLLLHPDLRNTCVPVVVGDVHAMRIGAARAGLDPASVEVIDDPRSARNDSSVIELIQVGDSLADVPVGELNAKAGDGAYRFVVAACALAKEGKADGIVTAPLNKAAMQAGGHKWPGHTELLAHEFGVKNFSLVLSAGELYIFHLTAHVSLAQAILDCTPDRTDDVLNLVAAFSRALGRPDERIGVAGLNPHAGENRIFGDEDADILQPAVARARERGINAHGPIPADALIPAAVRGRWNMVVVDHGTAFDIAGQGTAREASLVLSCQRAAQLAPGWGVVWEAAGPVR
jgi:4-hydroxy-L-threonine phosphate dehydrogenase PdxA